MQILPIHITFDTWYINYEVIVLNCRLHNMDSMMGKIGCSVNKCKSQTYSSETATVSPIISETAVDFLLKRIP